MSKFIQKCLSWVFKSLNLLANLSAENVALHHQLAVLKRNQKRLALKDRDRVFWVVSRKDWKVTLSQYLQYYDL